MGKKEVVVKNRADSSIDTFIFKALMDAFFKNSQDCVIYMKKNFMLEKISPSFTKITGYKYKQFEGTSALSIPILDMKAKLELSSHVKNSILKKSTEVYDLEIIKKNGQKSIVNISSSVVVLNKKIIGFIAYIKDITIEKKEQKKLKIEFEQFYELYNEAPIPYQSLDVDGKIKFVNKAWLSVLGYSKQFVIGEHFSSFLSDSSKIKFKKSFSKFKKKRHVEKSKLILLNKNKKPIQIIASGKWINDNNGKLLHTQCVFRDISSELIARQKLEEKERNLRKAQEISHVGSWEYNILTNNFSGSNEAKLIFGLDLDATEFTVDEVEGCTPERKRVHQALVDLIQRKKPFDLTYEIIQYKTKNRKTVHSIAELQIDSDGTKKVIGIIHDITEQISIQKTLELQKEKTKKLLDYADAIIVHLDLKGNIKLLNETGTQLLGVQERDILGKNWMKEFVPKKEQNKLKMVFGEILLKKQSEFKYFENHLKTKKGNFFLIKWKNSVLFDDKNNATGIISYGTDITKTHEIEKRQQQLLTGVEQVSETVVITDLGGNIQYVNPYFEKTTGYTFKEAVGQNPRFLKSGKQDKSYYKNLWDTISNGKTWIGEFVNVKKNGTEYTEEATISPVFDNNKKIIAYIALKTDITHQKKQEKEYSKQMKELEEFQEVVVNRELRMAEIEKENDKLKKEIEKLKKK